MGTEIQDFAAELRGLKERSGLSYGALAQKLHMSTSTVHRYCNGDAVPHDYAPVERFARVCRASGDELVALHRKWILADEAKRRGVRKPEAAAAPDPRADGRGQCQFRVRQRTGRHRARHRRAVGGIDAAAGCGGAELRAARRAFRCAQDRGVHRRQPAGRADPPRRQARNPGRGAGAGCGPACAAAGLCRPCAESLWAHRCHHQQRRRDAAVPPCRIAGGGVGLDDRCKHSRCAARHCGGVAHHAPAGLWACREHRLHRRACGVANRRRVLRHQIRGMGHLGRAAAGKQRHPRDHDQPRAISQPEDVDTSEIIMRPTASPH